MAGTNPVAKWIASIWTGAGAQDPSTWRTNVDHDFLVGQRILDNFAPRAQDTPNMTVLLDAGHIYADGVLTEVAAQSSATIVAPGSNSRIDRIVIDNITGAISVITGVASGSPAVPALSYGKTPIAQVLTTSSSVTITNSMITDERDFSSLGQPDAMPTNSIASAATTDLSTVVGSRDITLTGSTGPITSFGTVPAGVTFFVSTTSTPTITLGGNIAYGGSLGSIICDAGTQFILQSQGSGSWTILFLRHALMKSSIYVPASAMKGRTTQGVTATHTELVTNKINIDTLTFTKVSNAAGSVLYAQFPILMPKSWNGGTLTFKVHAVFLASTAVTLGFFSLAARAFAQGNGLDQAMGTAVGVTITGTGTINQEIISAESAAITVAGTPAGLNHVHFEFKRDVTSGSDTTANGVTIDIIGIEVYYLSNAPDDV